MPNIITMLEVINSNKNVHYDGFLQALDSGWKVSPVAGNDNHGLDGIKAQHPALLFWQPIKRSALFWMP